MRKIIFTLLLSNSFVYAQDIEFSLSQAKEYALEHSSDIKNSRLDLEKAQKKVWETTAMGLPQVSAKAEFQNFIDIPTTVLPAQAFNPLAPAGQIAELKFGTNYNLKGTIQVSQLIFSGNYLVGLQASKAFTKTSQILIEKQEIETKYNVSEAYYTVLLLQENKKILDSTLVTLGKLYAETKILVDEKVIESTNASQLRLSVLQVKNAQSQLTRQIEVAKNLLKFQMGKLIETPIELTDELTSFTETNTTIDLIHSNDNIDYKIVDSQLELNELSLKNTKANYLPTLAGYFSYQHNAQRYEFNFFDTNKSWYPTTLWGLTLNVPIFSSGQRAAQVSQTKIEVMKTENTLNNVDQAVKLQISRALATYYSNVESYETQKEASVIAEEILNSTTIKFKEGVVSSMDLSQAQNQFLTTQTSLTTAQYNLVKSKLLLDKLRNQL